MGHSRIFEVMFPGDPCKAYLVDANTIAENVLVVAHVLGHADFSWRNVLFKRSMQMAGGRILEQAAARAHRIEAALADHGQERVESVLDAALALEAHIDVNRALYRVAPFESAGNGKDAERTTDAFYARWQTLPGEVTAETSGKPTPQKPEYDLLWFLAAHGRELEPWERDVFLAVREESFYFYPVFACQIMNEGWASYWHARLLREANFLPQELYVQAIKAHSDVVRRMPRASRSRCRSIPTISASRCGSGSSRSAGSTKRWRFAPRKTTSASFATTWTATSPPSSTSSSTKRAATARSRSRRAPATIREAILAPKFNFGSPRVAATDIGDDGSLTLVHDHKSDGRGLDLPRAERVLDYVIRLWRKPVTLHTVDDRGNKRELTKAGPRAS